jgi:hypothetical protein
MRQKTDLSLLFPHIAQNVSIISDLDLPLLDLKRSEARRMPENSERDEEKEKEKRGDDDEEEKKRVGRNTKY